MSLAHYYLNNYQEAIKLIDKALEIHPKDKRLLLNKNLYLEKMNKKKESIWIDFLFFVDFKLSLG